MNCIRSSGPDQQTIKTITDGFVMKKFVFELFPVIVFFVAFKLSDFFIATAALMASMTLQILIMLYRKDPISNLQKISFVLVLVLGSVTLFLREEKFIQYKPTVLYWLTAAVFMVSALFFQKNMVKTLLSSQMKMPEAIWSRLNIGWIIFFLLMGIINLFVAEYYSQDVWATFKLFGTLGLLLVFFTIQGIYISRHIEKEA